MQLLLLGLLLLIVILLAGRTFVNADPVKLARIMKRVGGAVVLAAAFGLFVTGKVLLALPLAALGFWLIGKRLPLPWPGPDMDDLWTQRGQRSSVRTAMLEMSLDHDTGATEGRVLAGSYSGRLLSQLSKDELFFLLSECSQRDPQGAQLLRAYMDRLGIRQEEAAGPASRRANGMSVEEAYDVLGLKPGASHEEINQAHRALMKKIHPDQGGSTYLASKINEAKEVLLRQGP
jgi:hypothetical protein